MGRAGVAQGGTVKWIDLEHVWVEAYVDYTPSRGAVNRTPNTWVPLDASFKQYQFTQGMDITFVTSSKTDEEAKGLLEALGMPFRSSKEKE